MEDGVEAPVTANSRRVFIVLAAYLTATGDTAGTTKTEKGYAAIVKAYFRWRELQAYEGWPATAAELLAWIRQPRGAGSDAQGNASVLEPWLAPSRTSQWRRFQGWLESEYEHHYTDAEKEQISKALKTKGKLTGGGRRRKGHQAWQHNTIVALLAAIEAWGAATEAGERKRGPSEPRGKKGDLTGYAPVETAGQRKARGEAAERLWITISLLYEGGFRVGEIC